MTRYERKLFFERLVALRDAYHGEAHESTGMTVRQAMTFAARTYHAAAAADAADATAIASGLAKGSPRAG